MAFSAHDSDSLFSYISFISSRSNPMYGMKGGPFATGGPSTSIHPGGWAIIRTYSHNNKRMDGRRSFWKEYGKKGRKKNPLTGVVGYTEFFCFFLIDCLVVVGSFFCTVGRICRESWDFQQKIIPTRGEIENESDDFLPPYLRGRSLFLLTQNKPCYHFCRK